MLQFTGLQKVGHDLATEQQQQQHKIYIYTYILTYIYTYIQLTLEKCRFELHGSTYKQIFFNVDTAVLHGLWLAEPEKVEYQLWGLDQNGF